MTDADVDGAHIRTLLLTFLYRQMLPLVQGGYVYIGQPPLYRLAKGKNETYFLNDEELNNHLFTQASEKIKIICEDGEQTELTGENLVRTLRELSLYQKLVAYLSRMNIWEDLLFSLLTRDIRKADQFADKALVESIIEDLSGNKEMKVGAIRPCRWRADCYEVDVAVKGKAQIMTTLGPQIPLINEYRSALQLFPAIKQYIDKKFIVRQETKPGEITDIAVGNWSEMVETVRNESFKGSHLQRYKGLGEMNPEQLWDTTMNPLNRVLMQVSIKDVEAADEMFTTLMGDKVEPRREFIQNHALEVTDLDI